MIQTQSKPDMGPRVLTVRELVWHLRIRQGTAYRLFRERKLPAFRVGSDWRFKRRDGTVDGRRTETKLICVPLDLTAIIA